MDPGSGGGECKANTNYRFRHTPTVAPRGPVYTNIFIYYFPFFFSPLHPGINASTTRIIYERSIRLAEIAPREFLFSFRSFPSRRRRRRRVFRKPAERKKNIRIRSFKNYYFSLSLSVHATTRRRPETSPRTARPLNAHTHDENRSSTGPLLCRPPPNHAKNVNVSPTPVYYTKRLWRLPAADNGFPT